MPRVYLFIAKLSVVYNFIPDIIGRSVMLNRTDIKYQVSQITVLELAEQAGIPAAVPRLLVLASHPLLLVISRD